jgi:hypothetical protein
VLAYVLSGHRGIYPSQRLLRGKGGDTFARALSLRELSDRGAPAAHPPPPDPPAP